MIFSKEKWLFNQKTDGKEQRKLICLGYKCFWDWGRELSRGGDQPFDTSEKKVKVIKVIWSTNCCWRVLSTTHQLQKGHCVPRAFELAWVNSVVPSQRLTALTDRWLTYWQPCHLTGHPSACSEKMKKMSLRGNKGRKRGRNTPS